MKHFLDILANIRVGVAELGGTLALIFLIAYGVRKAWDDFVAPTLLSGSPKASPPAGRNVLDDPLGKTK